MSKALRIVAIIIALGIMTFAGVQLGTYFYEQIEATADNDMLAEIADSPIESQSRSYERVEPQAQNRLYNYARRLFGKATPGKQPISGKQTKASLTKAQKRKINFKALKKKNNHIIAWISIPNAPVDFAVMQTSNNTYYLKYNAMKKRSKSGAIFLDSKLKSNFDNQDSIVYGHRMRDGTMFGPLAKYKSRAYLRDHPYIFVYTPKATKKYKVQKYFRTTSLKLKPDRSKNSTLTLITCDGKKAHIGVRAQLVSSKKPGKK